MKFSGSGRLQGYYKRQVSSVEPTVEQVKQFADQVKRERKYIRNVRSGKDSCLYCDSDDLEYSGYDDKEGVITQHVRCGECERDWTLVYVLKTVRRY